jgi:hypothetical protein
MKDYTINDNNEVIVTSWFGLADLHLDYNIFKDPQLVEFLNFVKQVRDKTTLLQSQAKDVTNFTQEKLKEFHPLIEDMMKLNSKTKEYESVVKQSFESGAPKDLIGKKVKVFGFNMITGESFEHQW